MNRASIKSAFSKIKTDDIFKDKTISLLIQKQQIGEKNQRNHLLVATLTSCLVVVIVVLTWHMAEKFNILVLPISTTSLTNPSQSVTTEPVASGSTSITTNPTSSTDGIFIPAYEIKNNSNAASDMLGVIVYKDNIYIQSNTSIDIDHARSLMGEYLGKAKGNLDEWSTQDDYATEFASSVVCEVYDIQGYDSDFRIMGILSYDEGPDWACFYECLNDIYITNGHDVFSKLKLQNLDEIYYSSEEKAIIKSFIEALDETQPVLRVDHGVDILKPDGSNALHIKIMLKDGCRVNMDLLKGGYVYYAFMPVAFRMKDTEVFDAMWQLSDMSSWG